MQEQQIIESLNSRRDEFIVAVIAGRKIPMIAGISVYDCKHLHIVALKKGDKAFLLYGYGKNERANISVSHKKVLIEYANDLFALGSAKVAKSINDGDFTEVK